MIGNVVVFAAIGGPTVYLRAAVVLHELRTRRSTATAEPLNTTQHAPAADQRAA